MKLEVLFLLLLVFVFSSTFDKILSNETVQKKISVSN